MVQYGNNIKFVGIIQYLNLFKDEKFIMSMLNTMVFFSISIPIMLIFSYVLAKLLIVTEKSLKWNKLPFLMPILLPSGGITYAWHLLLGNDSFIGKNILYLSDWENKWQDLIPIIILFIWKNSGYLILIFIVGFILIPRSVYEASSLDGANKLKTEVYMTLPLMKQSIYISLVFSMIQGLKIGREIFMLYGENSKYSIYLIPAYFKERFLSMNIEMMSCAAIFFMFTLLLVIALCYFFLFKVGKN